MAEIVAIIHGLLKAPAKIKQYVFDPIKTQFNYVCDYCDIMDRLREQNGELKFTGDRLQQQIQDAEDNLHNINPNAEHWCKRVDQRREEIERFLDNEPSDQNDSRLQGTCTSLKLRYSRSRKATKLSAHIVKLLDEYSKFDGSISYPAPPTGVETIPVTSDTLEFDSRKQIEEEIMSYLKNPSICLIGVWGMGGVGKTTMAEKIGRRAIKEKQFEKVVKAVVSQQADLWEIQEQLAQGLGLPLTEKAVSTRATKLHARLMMNEKVLIILDDVWEWLDLKQLGIPFQTKLLLTTRDRYVCQSMYTEEATTRILELGFLNEKEAFSLFRKNVGHVVDQANLRPLAMDVARECKGLPLALVIVGRTMREKEDEWFWEDSLRQLQKSETTDVRGYRQNVYRPLKLSYDNLENFEDKYLFLLCCLFPEDSTIQIENLVRYRVGLPSFFSAATESISYARGRVNHKVENLVDRCLLMDAGYKLFPWPVCVKMHDVIRDMALSIASTGDHKFMVRHDKGVRELPRESYTCISLTLTEDMIFQEDMHCPGLQALFLTFDLSFTTRMLPENFLDGMADLTLLNINVKHPFRECVFGLPLSFLSSLTKLRVLHLDKCGLEDISLLGQVKDLEILSCHGSDIQVLPVGIRDLKKLKLLDMTHCWKLKNIASGVVSALVRLEELRLMGCPIEWERGETEDERRNASLAEIFSLKNLKFLEIWIRDLEVISQKMDYSLELTSYSVAIGPEGGAFFMEGSYTNLKRMSVCVDERRVFSDSISKLIEDVTELKLEGNGCKGIIELLGRKGFEKINSLQIDELGDVKILVQPTMHRRIFTILGDLLLNNMNDLEGICNGHPQVGSFSELEKITIKRCAKLKWVFPLSIAESLSKLQSIEVSDCPVVEEVLKGSESEITTFNHIKFPNLKKMELGRLPMLGAWCKAVDVIIELPSIESLDITKVSSNFKVFGSLQLAQVTCTKLKYSKMDNLDTEIFYREVHNGFFSLIERLEITYFHKLRVLFSVIVFKDLINLNNLLVKDCKMLEKMVEIENEDEGNTNVTNEKFIIQKLKYLELSNLPKICCFWPFNCALEFPSLQEVRIRNCPMMEALVVDPLCWNSNTPNSSFGQQVSCTMNNLGMEIFYREVPNGFFYGVQLLNIKSFHRLKVLFSLAVFKGLINLTILIVQDCKMLEDIVKMENEDAEHTNIAIEKIVIQKLQQLELSNLPKIGCFWPFSCALEFPSLQQVRIRNCPMMEALVVDPLCCNSNTRNSSFGQQVRCTMDNLGLINLKYLIVQDCKMLKYIVKMENEDAEHANIAIEKIVIQKLQQLHLSNLPKICCFWPFSCALEFPSLERVNITDCPMMEALAVDPLRCSSNTPSNSFGQQVRCQMYNLGMEIFDREISSSFFSGIEWLKIVSFCKLRVLFSLTVFKGLINLKYLAVQDCKMLEGIIKMENEDTEHTNIAIEKIVIQKLKELELSNLPKICCFWPFSCALEFPSLQHVSIRDCPMMEAFAMDHSCYSSNMPSNSNPKFFFGQQVICPELKNLCLVGLKISHMLFSPQTQIASLDRLKIKNCHNLKRLFNLRMFEVLTSLRDVQVQNCSIFELVIAKDEDEDVDEMVVSISNLESLFLANLPKLCCFSHAHRDLELPLLKIIRFSGCTEIMKGNFCLSGGSVRISMGVEVEGISNPEFASRFFFPTQHPQEEDSVDEGCFMLLPSDLLFTPKYPSVVKGPSNAFFLTRWKKALGKFDMEKLSPGITYEIAFVILLLESVSNDDEFETMLADEKREHKVKDMPRQQWMEILLGELRLSRGDITFSLEKKYSRTTVALKCAIIRPKNIALDVK